MKNLIKTISISLVTLISAIFFIIGYFNLNFNVMLIGILLIWGANFLFGILYIKKNINLLLYSCTFFVLLLGQKTVYMLQGTQWWKNFNADIYQETLFILYATLSSILLGSVIYHIYKYGKKERKREKNKSNYFEERKNTIRIVALVGFWITIFFKIILTIEKIIYVQENSYLALYTGFETIFPSYLKKIADLYFIFLTMYLFTFPKRKSMIKVLAIYVTYLVITIFIGSRGEFVTKILMIACYLAYRQFYLKNEKYYTKKTMIIISAVAIILIAFLGLYNYIRNDISVQGFSLTKAIKQFFIDQGISADVISYSVVYEDQLRARQQNYTFGFIINRFNSLIGKEQPTGLKETALYGNNLGAAISDLALKDRYLNGEGLGTQYLAELYIDYGYAGIIFYNFILGFLLGMTGYINEKKWLKNSIMFLMFGKIIYLPRQFAADWFIIFISSSYILSFVLVIAISEILYRTRNGKRYE